jgi:cytochrome c nitrite reductase small subunit
VYTTGAAHGEGVTKEPNSTGADRAEPTPWRKELRRLGFFPVALAVVLGILLSLGAFTFGYGKGAAYLSNDPAACANCHVMDDHYDSWQSSSHQHVAVCNDCHLPHDFFGKWVTKADNGFFHSLAFTLENFHEPIRIKPRNRQVTQNACLHCHRRFVNLMLPAEPDGDMLLCVHCHESVGHARR